MPKYVKLSSWDTEYHTALATLDQRVREIMLPKCLQNIACSGCWIRPRSITRVGSLLARRPPVTWRGEVHVQQAQVSATSSNTPIFKMEMEMPPTLSSSLFQLNRLTHVASLAFSLHLIVRAPGSYS